MNPLSLTGDDAPVVAFDGRKLTLLYANVAAYTARIATDDAAVHGLAGYRVLAAEVDEIALIGLPVGAGQQRVTYVLAPVVAVAPITESPKPRR